VYRWVQTFTPVLVDAPRARRHGGGDRWFVDETYLRVAGRWMYLHRAVDQFGQVIDVLLSDKRDIPAARRFFEQALSRSSRPAEINTDKAGVYPTVLDALLPRRLPRHRPVRQQPGVVRSCPAQSPAQADA
jgi:transposase-like protein